MIVLRSPKGWTGPAVVDGLPVEGTWRAHQVPLAEVRTNPAHLRQLEEWLRSYRPAELFDADGRPRPDLLRARAARGPAAGREPARQRRPAAARPGLPDFRDYAVDVPTPGRGDLRADPGARRHAAATSCGCNARQPQLPDRRAGRDRIQPARRGARGHRQDLGGPSSPAGGREPGRRRPGDGDPVRAHLPGLAGGLPADRAGTACSPATRRSSTSSTRCSTSTQVAQGQPGAALAAAGRVAELPADLARLAAGPQRLLAPGPRLHRPRDEQEGRGDPGLPAAGRQHAAVGGRPLPAQPRLRQRDRRRQAAVPGLAGHGLRRSCTAPAAPGSGSGPATTATARSRTSCWPAPATCRPWRCSRPPASSASTCRSCGSAWSTWST